MYILRITYTQIINIMYIHKLHIIFISCTRMKLAQSSPETCASCFKTLNRQLTPFYLNLQIVHSAN